MYIMVLILLVHLKLTYWIKIHFGHLGSKLGPQLEIGVLKYIQTYSFLIKMNYLYTAHSIQKATQRKCQLPSISPRENQVLKKQDHMIIFHRAIQSNNVMSIMCWFPEIPRIFQDNKKEYLTNSSALEVNLSRKWFIDSKSTSNSTLNLKLVLELKNSYLLLRKTSVKSNLLSPVCLKLDVQVYR